MASVAPEWQASVPTHSILDEISSLSRAERNALQSFLLSNRQISATAEPPVQHPVDASSGTAKRGLHHEWLLPRSPHTPGVSMVGDGPCMLLSESVQRRQIELLVQYCLRLEATRERLREDTLRERICCERADALRCLHVEAAARVRSLCGRLPTSEAPLVQERGTATSSSRDGQAHAQGEGGACGSARSTSLPGLLCQQLMTVVKASEALPKVQFYERIRMFDHENVLGLALQEQRAPGNEVRRTKAEVLWMLAKWWQLRYLGDLGTDAAARLLDSPANGTSPDAEPNASRSDDTAGVPVPTSTTYRQLIAKDVLHRFRIKAELTACQQELRKRHERVAQLVELRAAQQRRREQLDCANARLLEAERSSFTAKKKVSQVYQWVTGKQRLPTGDRLDPSAARDLVARITADLARGDLQFLLSLYFDSSDVTQLSVDSADVSEGVAIR